VHQVEVARVTSVDDPVRRHVAQPHDDLAGRPVAVQQQFGRRQPEDLEPLLSGAESKHTDRPSSAR